MSPSPSPNKFKQTREERSEQATQSSSTLDTKQPIQRSIEQPRKDTLTSNINTNPQTPTTSTPASSSTPTTAAPTMSSNYAASMASSVSSSSIRKPSMDSVSSEAYLMQGSHRSSLDKLKARISGASGSRKPSNAQSLADSEAEFEKQRAKALKKQQREEEYRRLGLDKQTKYGMPGGSGSWHS